MLIKEVCQVCDLTKKAVEYYELQGFIQPKVLDNGYRNYTDTEVAILKEISMLRKCGIDIKNVFPKYEGGRLYYLSHLRGIQAISTRENNRPND